MGGDLFVGCSLCRHVIMSREREMLYTECDGRKSQPDKTSTLLIVCKRIMNLDNEVMKDNEVYIHESYMLEVFLYDLFSVTLGCYEDIKD